MEIGNLSPTKLKQFRECEARLNARINDDDFEDEAGEPARIGQLAHMAAMLWYSPQLRDMSEDRDGVFNRAIAATGQDRMSDMPSQASSLGLAKDMFNAIANRFDRTALNIIFAERRYRGTLRGLPMHLVVDLAFESADGGLEIIDFKTGFISMPDDEMRDEEQVIMNLFATRYDPSLKRFKRHRFSYFWVRDDRLSLPVELSEADLNDVEVWLRQQYAYIKSVEEPRETPNSFCVSCSRRSQCEAYRSLIAEAFAFDEAKADAIIESTDTDETIRQHERIGIQAKVLDRVRSALSDRLTTMLRQGGLKNLEGTEGLRATLTQKATYRTNVWKLYELAKTCDGVPAFVRAARINHGDIPTILAKHPDADGVSKAVKVAGVGKPFVTVRRIKPPKTTKGKK